MANTGAVEQERCFRSEGADDRVAAVLHCAGNLPHIPDTALYCRQEMKDTTIMPNIVPSRRQFLLRDVCNEPVHPVRHIAPAAF